MKKPKVLLACLFADFGQNGNMLPDFSNCSWEYENIYKPWKKLADEGLIELETHWVDTQSNAPGLERLMSIAKEVDFIFQVPVTHALGIHLPQAKKIIDDGTPIISYHPDIHLRFRHPAGDRFVYSRITEGYDTHAVSPALHMMSQLLAHGANCYHMPFGISDTCVKQVPNEGDTLYDVTFVAQKHGLREQVISQIRGAGIKVDTWGHFWPDHPDHHGRPGVAEMASIFNRSKVNLNLRWCSRSPDHGQIKGRDFELLGCGAFMVASQHVECDDFHQIYEPGKEFVEYHFVDEMIEGIRYYLEHDEERQAIADAAYLKREENLWTSRFKKFLNDWQTDEGWCGDGWNV